MQLVRVQDVQLARKASAPGAAVPERLHACSRDADGVRVVAVAREPGRREPHGGPLDPRRARAEHDRIPAAGARSFKTAGLEAP